MKVNKMVKARKLNLWLKAFLDDSNPTTFLHRTESAKAAGYRCCNDQSYRQVGSQNYQKLAKIIERWLYNAGISDTALKIKLVGLLEAKETKLVKMNGTIKYVNLPAGCKIIAESEKNTRTEEGEELDTGETLIQVDIEALETQRRTLDMAFKILGMYASEKNEHIGNSGGIITITASPSEPKLLKE